MPMCPGLVVGHTDGKGRKEGHKERDRLEFTPLGAGLACFGKMF